MRYGRAVSARAGGPASAAAAANSDRKTEHGMRPSAVQQDSLPVRYFPDMPNDSNESSAMLNHSYCWSRNFFQGS